MRHPFVLLLLLSLWGCDRPAPPPPITSASASASPTSALATPASPAVGPSASGAHLEQADAASSNATLAPSAFEAIVGEWRPEDVAGVKGFAVDGTKWRDGTPSANLADQAKRLYGDRYAEFLDGVKAFAFYPLAIASEAAPAGDVRLSVRFFPIAGKIDQAAGIAFGIGQDGSYWGVRANALEDNVLFFRVVKGKRTVLATIRGVPTPTGQWHTLVVDIRGEKVEASVDGVKRLEQKLETAVPPGRRVGLWSKADSHVVFADFAMTKP